MKLSIAKSMYHNLDDQPIENIETYIDGLDK